MSDQSISRFWENFISKSTRYGINLTGVRWYIRHTEQYIKAHSELRLSQHNALTVESYLQNKGRNPALKDWQFVQIVTALQILFVELVKSSWAGDFDWQHWKASARELSSAHATVARDYEPLVRQTASATETSAAKPLFREKFPKEFERLITEIRIRHYSIRTEQAYTMWVARFIRFSKLDDLRTIDASCYPPGAPMFSLW